MRKPDVDSKRGVTEPWNPKMSQMTRREVLAKKRDRYARAGKEHKTKIINELVDLFGYHRKAAIRALQPRPVLAAPFVVGRPKEYDPEKLRARSRPFGWIATTGESACRIGFCGNVIPKRFGSGKRITRRWFCSLRI